MKTFQENDCGTAYALRVIDGKWKLPALFVLCENGAMRYNELKRVLGITNMMLSSTLKELESYKLVNRVQFNEIPPHVEYSVTDLGKKLLPVLEELGKWGDLIKNNR